MQPPIDRPEYALRFVGGYREYSPPAELGSVVDAAWDFCAPRTSAGTIVGHLILPEPGVSLTFTCVRDSAGRVLDASLDVQGPIRTVQPFAPDPAKRLEAVRLAPEWSRVLLRADPAEHANGIVPYALVNPSRAPRLYDRLLRTTSSRDALRLLMAEVGTLHEARRLPGETSQSQVVTAAIRTHRGRLALERMARTMSLSVRHLRRLVHEAAGIGPRELHRIHRLNRAVFEADRCGRPRWARIALEAGYCDQSHMIRDFLTLTGHSPADLHRGRQAENGAS